ncbi:MAG: hypothetical protein AAB469_02065 [Patescibacteria group bacterium]
MTVLAQTYFAIATVLKKRNYVLLVLTVSIFFFGLFVLIPLITIPGNDLQFQLGIFRTGDYILMAFLALLVGFNLALRAYSFKQKRESQNISQSVAGGAASGLSGVFGAVVGTAACASCLASLFGLVGLGTGSVFFVLQNQSYFLIGAIAAMLTSLYFVARKINKVCISC